MTWLERILLGNALFCCFTFNVASAAAPDAQPILRVETGMHSAAINRLATDASGRWMVTASDDKTVRIWDLASISVSVADAQKTGRLQESPLQLIRTLRPPIGEGNEGKINAVAMASNGDLIACGGSTGLAYEGRSSIYIFDRAGGEMKHRISGLPGVIKGLAYSPDGRFLAIGLEGRNGLLVLDADTNRAIARDGEYEGDLVGLAFSIDSRLATSATDGFIRIYDNSFRLLRKQKPADIRQPGDITFSPDGTRLAVGNSGASRIAVLMVSDLAPVAVRQTADDASAALPFVTWSKDGSTVIAGGNLRKDGGYLLRVLAEAGMGEQKDILLSDSSIRHLLTLPNGTLAYAASAPEFGVIRQDGSSVLRQRAGPAQAGQPSALRVSSDGNVVSLSAGNVEFSLTERQFITLSSISTTLKSSPDTATGLTVSLYDDGTIHWKRSQDGKELLALFLHSDGKRWVAWTPSGYYDAAPGAESLLGWHFNNGIDSEAAFFPAAKFRAVYYKPEVVSRILNTRDEAEAVKLTAESAGDGKAAKVAIALLPPVVTILSPVNGSTAEGKTADIVIAIKSPDNEAVTEIKILVDGRPVTTGVEELTAENGQRRFRVPLSDRDCSLSVIAANKNSASEPATIRLLRKASAKSEEDSFSILPKLYILAIGVGAYPDKDMKLAFAAKDAQDFAATLVKQKGGIYRDVTVRTVTDAAANRATVLEGFEWLQRQTTSKDVAVVFLAGHGVTDNNGIYYFLPVDADVNRLKSTGVIFTEIRNTLSSIAGKAILFVDTCHSGNIMGTRRAVADINAVVNELVSAEVGTVVFTSSTGRQYSLEDPMWGNGAFTKALVEGLNGKADYSGKGRITINMLDLFISERVKELTDGKQTPTTAKPQTVQDFPLAVKW